MLQLLPIALCLALLPMSLAQSSNNDPSGKPLFVSMPFCSSYQCTIPWTPNTMKTIQWLNPTPGNVSIQLISRANYTFAYNISLSTPATTSCTNNTSGLGCGEFNFTSPCNWVPQNYSIVVTSLNDSSIQGYSDVVSVTNASNSTVSASASVCAPSTSLLFTAIPFGGSFAKSSASLPQATQKFLLAMVSLAVATLSL